MHSMTETSESEREPVVLHTERLILRLADPYNDKDCKDIIRLYNDPHAGLGGNAKVSIKSNEDVRAKHQSHGPRAELCTLAPPPYGMMFLCHLLQPGSSDTEGDLIGAIGMSFRPEMPYPDIGYMLFLPYNGKGYASEAGKTVLQWWRDVIGVKEIFCGALEDNFQSQRLAERIGFVRAGTFNVVFGHPPDEKMATALAFVLPGMEWEEGRTIRPTIGVE